MLIESMNIITHSSSKIKHLGNYESGNQVKMEGFLKVKMNKKERKNNKRIESKKFLFNNSYLLVFLLDLFLRFAYKLIGENILLQKITFRSVRRKDGTKKIF